MRHRSSDVFASVATPFILGIILPNLGKLIAGIGLLVLLGGMYLTIRHPGSVWVDTHILSMAGAIIFLGGVIMWLKSK